MGCICVKQKIVDDYKEHPQTVLAAQTFFTEKDVRSLYDLFKKLSSCIIHKDFITKEELQLGLFQNSKRQSLFIDRIFSLFDMNNDGIIEFNEFVLSLNTFHPDTSQEEKAAFVFRLYGLRETGFIEHEDIKEMTLALMEESDMILTDEIVEAIINKTFEEADMKGDGKIDIEEWQVFAAKNPSILKNMTIPYLKDITMGFPSFVQKQDVFEDEIYN
ncbi:calcineurin B-like protein 7 [Impatiens glandulifera]|uniref:calcineurin B-like protein 7 n=1 Tax=Impatiens glandulifera TaxID=253017 RepID=UPI001FB0A32A|nr:calcineurin B-like protein 7 [Impatiens glandulifera]